MCSEQGLKLPSEILLFYISLLIDVPKYLFISLKNKKVITKTIFENGLVNWFVGKTLLCLALGAKKVWKSHMAP